MIIENKAVDFRETILSEPINNRADVIEQAIALGSSISRTFGNLADIFPEVMVENPLEDLPTYNYPVFYKVFLPSGKVVSRINYFYVFSYIRKDVKSLNVYFQSAAVSDKSQTESAYSLASGSIRFEALKSAFMDKTTSFVSISDPGHFVKGAPTSFYVGSAGCDFSYYIASFIERLLLAYNLPHRRTLLFGSSAGAVGALMCGAILSKKVNVLSVNCQLELASRRWVLKKFFDGLSRQEAEQQYGTQLSCFKRYEEVSLETPRKVPNIYLLCNIRDDLHSRNVSFFEFLIRSFSNSEYKNQFVFDSYYGVEGHGRPKPVQLKEKMKIARKSLTMSSN